MNRLSLAEIASQHIPSPGEMFAFDQQVKQARQNELDQQRKRMQDQQMRQLMQDPSNMDPDTGGFSLKGIKAGGQIMGAAWEMEVAKQYAQNLQHISSAKKTMFDMEVKKGKSATTTMRDIMEKASSAMVDDREKMPEQQAFANAREHMESSINDFFSSGQAAAMGLKDEDKDKWLASLPKNAEQLIGSQRKLSDQVKRWEAMAEGTSAPSTSNLAQSGQPITLAAVSNLPGNAGPTATDVPTNPVVSLGDIAKAGAYDEIKSRADAERRAGRIANADRLDKQAKDELAKESLRIKQEAEQRKAHGKGETGSTPRQSSLSNDAINTAGFHYLTSRQLPSNIARSYKGEMGPEARDIINKAARLQKEMGLSAQDVEMIVANNKALAPALTQLQKQKNAIEGFERTLLTNINEASGLSKQLWRTGSPLLNKPLQSIQQSGLGSEEDKKLIARMYIRNEAIAAEVGKIMSGSMGNAQLAQSAQDHARQLLNTAMSDSTYQAAIKEIQSEVEDGRVKGLRAQVKQMLREMTNPSPDAGDINTVKSNPEKPTKSDQKSPAPKTIHWDDLK